MPGLGAVSDTEAFGVSDIWIMEDFNFQAFRSHTH